MRILVCSLEAPLPPPNGLRLQVAALVRELRNSHSVHVLAFRMPDQAGTPDPDDMRLIPRKASVRPWWDATAGLPPGTADALLRLRKPLREELGRFDPEVVHVTSGRLALLAAQLADRPAVLAALDAWHLNVAAESDVAVGADRLMRRVEGALVRRFERQRYGRFDRVVVVTEADRRALLEVNPNLRIEVIPNGVDADAFDWDGTQRDRHLILFTGVMSYAPNVTAAEFLARRILPRVGEAFSSVRLVLVGRGPSSSIRALGALPGVEVVGEVPDMRPWLSRAGVYVCPMLTGTGMKNKLLEAMANGLACVATPLAVQGLAVTHGQDILMGSTEEELARHVIRLIQEPVLADRIGVAGRAYVRSRHTWTSMAARYEQIYRQLASGPELP